MEFLVPLNACHELRKMSHFFGVIRCRRRGGLTGSGGVSVGQVAGDAFRDGRVGRGRYGADGESGHALRDSKVVLRASRWHGTAALALVSRSRAMPVGGPPPGELAGAPLSRALEGASGVRPRRGAEPVCRAPPGERRCRAPCGCLGLRSRFAALRAAVPGPTGRTAQRSAFPCRRAVRVRGGRGFAAIITRVQGRTPGPDGPGVPV